MDFKRCSGLLSRDDTTRFLREGRRTTRRDPRERARCDRAQGVPERLAAALLHYFGSKEELFTEVLRTRDEHDLKTPQPSDPSDAKAAFVEVIRRNAEVPGVVELFSRLSVDAVDPEHPAHRYFLDRSERLRESIAVAFESGDERRAALDPDTMARVIQAVSDGLQLQWMIDRSVDMPGIIEALMDVLYPPATEASPASTPEA